VIVDTRTQSRLSEWSVFKLDHIAPSVKKYRESVQKRKELSDHEISNTRWRRNRVKAAAESDQGIGDDDYLICMPTVSAFALGEKFWAENLLVTGLKEIEWKEDPFKSLQLAVESKTLIRALVKGFGDDSGAVAEDLIENKGIGLIFLLHGGPGLGKTLTAGTLSIFLDDQLRRD
jgi:hypothetical protein